MSSMYATKIFLNVYVLNNSILNKMDKETIKSN